MMNLFFLYANCRKEQKSYYQVFVSFIFTSLCFKLNNLKISLKEFMAKKSHSIHYWRHFSLSYFILFMKIEGKIKNFEITRPLSINNHYQLLDAFVMVNNYCSGWLLELFLFLQPLSRVLWAFLLTNMFFHIWTYSVVAGKYIYISWMTLK